MKKIIHKYSEKHKTLFLIDSIGACMTAFFLFVIARPFDAYFGMPKLELTYLSVIAICFSIYSAACSVYLKRGVVSFMRIIGIANLSYCALTIGLLINYRAQLTFIGMTYFSIEIVIICLLSYIELSVAARKKEALIN